MPTAPPSETPVQFVTGLDLGQAQDFSALVTVRWNDRLDPDGPPTPDGGPCYARRYGIPHLVRWPLRTSYPAIVADVKTMFGLPPLAGSVLVVDATGVGAAVVDMFREAEINADLKAYVITAGFKPGEDPDHPTVPKADLVGAVVAASQSRRLAVARGLDLAETLSKELEAFRAKVTADRNETFSAWREKDHDDLVLAAALAVWVASRERVYDPDPYALQHDPAPVPDPSPWGAGPERDPFA